MRMLLVAVATSAMLGAACSPPVSQPDVLMVTDTGPAPDVVRVDVPVADTDTTCTFVPGEVNVSCRVLASVCTTGPITCDGGQSFANSTCRCQTVHMGNQVWRCDNFCSSGTDAEVDVNATDATDATDAVVDTGATDSAVE